MTVRDECTNLATETPADAGQNGEASRADLSLRAGWICFALVVLIYVVFRIHAVGIPLDRDEGVFGYTAQRILEGGKPYLDAVDHKPPGVFYLYALALRFVPATATGIHLFLLVYNFLTLSVLAGLMRMLFASRLAAVAAAFCYAIFSVSPAIQGFTASTEMLALLPITLSLLLAVWGAKRGNLALVLLSGAAAAGAFWIKQTAFTAAVFALIYLIAAPGTDGRLWSGTWRVRLRQALVWCAGAGVVAMAVCGYFYSSGLFPQFFYWSFTHNAAYATQASLGQLWGFWKGGAGRLMSGDFLVVGLGIIVALWQFRSRRSESLLVLGFLVCSIAGTLPGFGYAHYFAEIAPAVAVASGWGLAVIAQDRQLPRLVFLILLLGIAVSPLYVYREYFIDPPESFSRSFYGSNPFPESPQLSAYLGARTTPEDRIFIFGSEPQILFEAQRKSATPFVMIYPLTQEYARYREFQDQVWRDIEGSHPAYILMVGVPASLVWDGKAKLEILNRVRGLIAEQYTLAAVMPVTSGVGHLAEANEQRPDFQDQVRTRPNILVFSRAAGAAPTTSTR